MATLERRKTRRLGCVIGIGCCPRPRAEDKFPSDPDAWRCSDFCGRSAQFRRLSGTQGCGTMAWMLLTLPRMRTSRAFSTGTSLVLLFVAAGGAACGSVTALAPDGGAAGNGGAAGHATAGTARRPRRDQWRGRLHARWRNRRRGRLERRRVGRSRTGLSRDASCARGRLHAIAGLRVSRFGRAPDLRLPTRVLRLRAQRAAELAPHATRPGRAARDPRPAQRPMQRACRRTSREPPARCETHRRVTTPRGVAPVCLVLLARWATGPVALGIRAVRAAPPSHRSPARRAPRRTSSVPTAACAASRSGMTSNARTASGSK